MDQLLAATKTWLETGVTSGGVNEDTLAVELSGTLGPAEKVVWRCVDTLAELQSMASGKREVIAIALEDMKTVSMLMRIIACYGIYPCVGQGVGPPMEKRTDWVLKKDPDAYSSRFLERLVERLVTILEPKDDLADIILIGPYVVDIMTGALYYDQLFERFSALLPTYTLYQLYTGILPHGPPWVQQKMSHYLATMPLQRTDAVRALIEFLTGFRESEHVNTGMLAQVVQVLQSVPKNTSPQDYARAVGAQLFNLLSSIGLPSEIASATVKVVADLSEIRPQMLGTLRDRILQPLLSPQTILEPSLMALNNLVDQPNTFVRYLAERAALPAWVLLCFLTQSKRPNGSTLRLLVGLLDSDPAGALANSVSQFLAVTSVNSITFGPSADGGVESRAASSDESDVNLESLTFRVDLFMTVLTKVKDKVVSALFAHIISRYTAKTQRDPMSLWVDVKLLESISTELKAKLFANVSETADLALGIVKGAVDRSLAPERLEVSSPTGGDSDDESEEEEDDNDLVEMALSLLGGVILEAVTDVKVVKRINKSRHQLEALARSSDKSVRVKATQCLDLIDTVMSGNDVSLGDDNVDFDDSAALLKVARESLANPLIPVRAHGLRLVTELVKRKNVISLDEALEIMLKEIRDDDSFIYLNAIRGLEACSVYVGPGPLLRKLVEFKSDNVDVFLRVREAVTRIVQLFGPTISLEDLRYFVDLFAGYSRPGTEKDDRLRMSSLSILGLLIQASPLALTSSQESDVADLVVGVLTHERADDQAIVRRSAVTLLLEVMNSRTLGGFQSLTASTLQSLRTQLEVATTDSDPLLREDARELIRSFG